MTHAHIFSQQPDDESLAPAPQLPYRGVFEATTEGLVIRDQDGTILEVNPAMCAMHGYTRDEFLKLSPTAWIHPDYHATFEDYIRSVREQGHYQTRAIDIRKDGSQFHVEVQGTTFVLDGKTYVMGMVRDVTDRVVAYELLEQRVQERTRELSSLLAVSRAVASTLELRPLLGLILDQLHVVADYTGASVLQTRGDELAFLDSRGPAAHLARSGTIHIPISQLGIIWSGLSQGEPIIIDDVRGDTPFARAYQQATGVWFDEAFSFVRSWLAVPLILNESLMGILTLSHQNAQMYTSQHASLALGIANQVVLAIENARLYEDARGKAALEERQRLARDLHDSVSQSLFSASLIAEVLPHLWLRNAREGQRRLEELRLLTRGALAEMRMLLLELRPSALTEMPLGDLLRQIAESTTGRARLPVEMTVDGQPRAVPSDVQLAIYRIAQETVHNAVKHAEASRVDLRLSYLPDGLRVLIADNGRGFATDVVTGDHLGLRIMRERAAAVGGSVTIESEVGSGTRVMLIWSDGSKLVS